jgi:hypothetical protein
MLITGIVSGLINKMGRYISFNGQVFIGKTTNNNFYFILKEHTYLNCD